MLLRFVSKNESAFFSTFDAQSERHKQATQAEKQQLSFYQLKELQNAPVNIY